jgi:hypothetical protein
METGMKKRKTNEEPVISELKELSNLNPIKSWVALLIFNMFKNNLERFTLEKSKGIPPLPSEEELPEGDLDFCKIINRLKIMSGLDPVLFKQQRQGSIDLLVNGVKCEFLTTFLDSDSGSKCEIRFIKKI